MSSMSTPSDSEVSEALEAATPVGNRHYWYCNVCGEQNSREDGECQFCECGGIDCRRNSCSAVEHFHRDHVDGEPCKDCVLCAVEGRSAPLHTTDVDCAGHLDANDECRVCHVWHGDPCHDCGGRGYHGEDCA